MKIFLDANILVSVLNKEYPVFTYAARVLSLADKNYELYTSSSCLAIAFYFSSKKSGVSVAKNKIGLLAQKIKIADIRNEDVLAVVNDKKIHDFEDGLQFYAAKNVGCSCIITENIEDYYFSSIEILSTEQFLIKHVLRKKR